MLIRHSDPAFSDICIFDDFKVNGANILANTACTSIAGNCDPDFLPVYIYGPHGSGKSHLLKATFDTLRERLPHNEVVLLNSEGFMAKSKAAFSDKRALNSIITDLADADIIIFDDVHLVTGEDAEVALLKLLRLKQEGILMAGLIPPGAIPFKNAKLRRLFGELFCIDILPVDNEIASY